MTLEHFLSVGDLLIARVQAQLPGAFKVVKHAADLAGIKDSLQVTPALHIIFLGHKIGAQLSDASARVFEQRWMTVIVTRSARQAKSGAGAMALAGPLASQLLAQGTIAGWRPAEQCSPLAVVSPSVGAAVSDAGVLYVPLEWALTVKEI